MTRILITESKDASFPEVLTPSEKLMYSTYRRLISLYGKEKVTEVLNRTALICGVNRERVSELVQRAEITASQES